MNNNELNNTQEKEVKVYKYIYGISFKKALQRHAVEVLPHGREWVPI